MTWHPSDCSVVALVDIYIAYGVTSGFMHFVKFDLILEMTNFFAKRWDWEVL